MENVGNFSLVDKEKSFSGGRIKEVMVQGIIKEKE